MIARLGGLKFRISVLAIGLTVLAACGAPNRQQSQGPAASTIVATIPDVPDPSADPVAIAATAGQSVTLNQTVWANYQDYLKAVGQIGTGYYFVTEDGVGGGSWACGNALCEGSFDGQGAAKKQCEATSPGKTCILFAKDDRIQMKYEVAP